MKNKKILILGASGQIGKELSIRLKDKVNLYCHVRSEIAATYFKENNINYISGDLNTKEIINEISISDVIFDLASPYSGTLFQTKQFYKDRLELVIKNMKKNTKFIFASSINAFGMSEHRRLFKDYFIPSSIYCANKRFAEKLSQKLGKQNTIDIYLLRLSEVHGKYQRSSDNLKKLISQKYIFEVPDTPAWVVSISTIEEALIKIIENKEKPGLYTLTNDHIYWSDLLKFFAKEINSEVKINIKKNIKPSILSYLKNIIRKLVVSRRDLIRGNIAFTKDFEEIKKLNFRIETTKLLNNNLGGIKYYKELNKFLGVLPGKRLTNLAKNDSFYY
ncbi:NAD(P)-dependent oxidoreductase [Candidatus Pelagibacter sp.]|nr:NAD(P)-dependent oxidoreductase [Candidatus Pelagibacter sp.]MDB4246576.1 NAD(P)-dependent oxidoreductase [Candidatus Pelagibacter sp.]